MNDSWHRILENGDLSGFYLCGGSSHESVALLQVSYQLPKIKIEIPTPKYLSAKSSFLQRLVDLQGDVQLASWMAVKTLTVELAR